MNTIYNNNFKILILIKNNEKKRKKINIKK